MSEKKTTEDRIKELERRVKELESRPRETHTHFHSYPPVYQQPYVPTVWPSLPTYPSGPLYGGGWTIQ